MNRSFTRFAMRWLVCLFAFFLPTLGFAQTEELCSVTVTKEKGAFDHLTNVAVEGLTDGKIKKGSNVRLRVNARQIYEYTITANGVEVQKPVMIPASQELVKDITINEDTEIVVSTGSGVSVDLYVDDEQRSEDEFGSVELEGTYQSAGLRCAHRQEIIVNATPKAGYKVKQVKLTDWSTKTDTDITSEMKFTPTKDAYAVEVFFAPEEGVSEKTTCTVSLAQPTGAKSLFALVDLSKKGEVNKGEVVRLKATPIFVAEVVVLLNGEPVQEPVVVQPKSSLELDITIEEDARIEVQFNATVTLKFDPAGSPNGTVRFNGQEVSGSLPIVHNTPIFVEATPNEGFQVKSILLKGFKEPEFTDITAEPAFVPTKPNYEVKVIFEKIGAEPVEKTAPLRIYLGKDEEVKTFVLKKEDGTALELPERGIDGQDVYYDFNLLLGSKYKLELTANEGYEIKDINSNFAGMILNNEFIFSVYTEDTKSQITVNVQPKKFEVSFPDFEGGEVKRKGFKIKRPSYQFKFAQKVKLEVTANEGYELESLTVGGKKLSEPYEFVVGTDNTIVAKFRKIIVKTTALESIDAGLRLYPNPASDFAVISGLQSGELVRLVSLSGTTMLTQKANDSGEVRLELTKLARGLYIVRTADKAFKLQLK